MKIYGTIIITACIAPRTYMRAKHSHRSPRRRYSVELLTATVGGGVRALVIEMTVNVANAYYVASTLYRRLPPVIRDLRAEPTGLFKRLITTWLRMIGSDNVVSPHSHLPLLTTLYYNYFQLLCRRELPFHTPGRTRSQDLFERLQYSTLYQQRSTLPRLLQLGNEIGGSVDFFSPGVARFRSQAVRLLTANDGVGDE
ncbi:hypothetical protein J6590_071663 [Homalodisca vitripennis]|nr:hypothetical protein J6590_071663 [Homalodisca vitripennis]